MTTTEHLVANNRRTRDLPKIIFGQTAFALLITFVALSIAFYAQGYRYDFKNLKLINTGVLVLEYQPRDSMVYINDKQISAISGNIAKNYRPGMYSIRVSKANYTSYEQETKVSPRSVTIFDKVTLFLTNPVISPLSDQSKLNLLSAPSEDLTNSNVLSHSKYEIWSGDRLITRFAAPIDKAIWYTDLRHIVYKQGDEIRVIGDDGKNDTLLIKLTSSTNIKFVISSRGDEIYYQESGKNYQAIIK
ncbi:MAG: hypothetical protein WC227_02965 [Patescibacteria group bacterium]|jgi:hypothetical protein